VNQAGGWLGWVVRVFYISTIAHEDSWVRAHDVDAMIQPIGRPWSLLYKKMLQIVLQLSMAFVVSKTGAWHSQPLRQSLFVVMHS